MHAANQLAARSTCTETVPVLLLGLPLGVVCEKSRCYHLCRFVGCCSVHSHMYVCSKALLAANWAVEKHRTCPNFRGPSQHQKTLQKNTA